MLHQSLGTFKVPQIINYYVLELAKNVNKKIFELWQNLTDKRLNSNFYFKTIFYIYQMINI